MIRTLHKSVHGCFSGLESFVIPVGLWRSVLMWIAVSGITASLDLLMA
ncbi:hypothetical protein [Prochlorococcus marinus]|nr:hypothetical protein [Prochlorococcus marinus]